MADESSAIEQRMRAVGLRRKRGSVRKREEGDVYGSRGRRRSDWAGRSVRVFMVDGGFGFGFNALRETTAFVISK